MKYYIALIPEKKFINQIYLIRQDVVKFSYGQKDDRVNVLPHVCISYLNETDDTDIMAQLEKSLDDLSFINKISLVIKNFGNYGHKVVAMFNPADTKAYVEEIEIKIEKYNLSGNKKYVEAVKTPVGDHLKIVRNVLPESINDVKNYSSRILSKAIIFDRIVLIGYECEEKDIFWQRQLT